MTSDRLGAKADSALSWIGGNVPNKGTPQEFRSVPVAEIHEHDYFRLREPPYPGVDTLAGDIKERGQTTPLFVRPRQDGGYDLIAGYRRRAALEKAGVLTALVRVYERLATDDDAALDLAVSENRDREDVSDWERADLAQRLQSKGRTYEQIAASLHLSDVQVKRLLRIAKNASEPLRTALQQRQITFALATKFLELGLEQKPEEEQRELLAEVVEQDFSVREFTRLVSRRKPRRESNGGEEKAPSLVRQAKNGTIAVSLRIAPNDEVEAIDERIAALQQALKLARKLKKQREEGPDEEVSA